MLILKLGKLVLSMAIVPAMVGFFSISSHANRLAPSEVKLMTQNSNDSAKENEIQLPDNLLKQVEAMEKKARRERAEASARRMAQKTPKQREEMEKERKKLEEIEFAPETRTEEEIRREDERAIKIFDQLKPKNRQ